MRSGGSADRAGSEHVVLAMGIDKVNVRVTKAGKRGKVTGIKGKGDIDAGQGSFRG